jgi:hypothetical protein
MGNEQQPTLGVLLVDDLGSGSAAASTWCGCLGDARVTAGAPEIK